MKISAFIIYFVCRITLPIILFQAFTFANIRLKLSNDGPAVLDSHITFYATLEGVPMDDYSYVFEDNTKAQNNTHTILSGMSANLTLLVSSKEYKENIYTMKVAVFKLIFKLIPQRIAIGKMSFKLSNSIVGDIVVEGGYTNVIPVGKMLNYTYELHDPSHFFDNAEFYYVWKFNQSAFSLSKATTPYQSNTTGRLSVDLSVFAKITITVGNTTTYDIKTALSQHNYTVLAPIGNINVQGSVWMGRGEVVNLVVTCNGSGPYSYCWRAFLDNSTDICDGDTPITVTQCTFNVRHYFKYAGKYNFGILIKNRLNEAISHVQVQIYDVDKKPQMSTIIYPIVSCLLGIIIIVIGAAYHLQQRRRYAIEVADFDFQEPVMLIEKSFVTRVKESIKDAIDNYRSTPRSEQKLSLNGSSRTTPISSHYVPITS